jgi:hypothetical protein
MQGCAGSDLPRKSCQWGNVPKNRCSLPRRANAGRQEMSQKLASLLGRAATPAQQMHPRSTCWHLLLS